MTRMRETIELVSPRNTTGSMTKYGGTCITLDKKLKVKATSSGIEGKTVISGKPDAQTDQWCTEP